MTDQPTAYGPDHALERLVFFSDAVFAIAITLLIIEVRVPNLPPNASDAQWVNALIGMSSSFGAFALSFLVIAAFWIVHHSTLSMLSRFDRRLIWPNMHLLMSIAFLPFSTALLSHPTSSRVPCIFYAASLLVTGLLKLRLTLMALRPGLVAPDVPADRILIERRRAMLMPAASLLALILSFLIPYWSLLALLVIPIARRTKALELGRP